MRFFIFIFAGLFSHLLFATDAISLLQEMSQAVKNKNYQGTFVYQQGNKLETMQVTHLLENKHERELLSSLTGQAREVFRDNQAVICVIPGAASIDKRISKKGFSGRFIISPQQLSKTYQFKKTKITRIAGRDCQTIEIKPKDKLRYGYTLCIDLKDALPLRIDMNNHQNKRLSRIMFTQLNTNQGIQMPIPRQIQNRTKLNVSRHKPATSMPYTESNWKINKIPNGFQIQFYEQHQNKHAQQALEHFVFSDGLVSISVYIEKADKNILKGFSHIGAVNIFARSHQDYQIVAVGEVPSETLKQLANNFSK